MPIKIAKPEILFKSPGTHPNGLQATPDGLWCIDQADHKIHRLDYQSGEVLFVAQTDTVHSSGITLGGGYLWIASTYENKIAQLDPTTGATIAKHDSPGSGIVALVSVSDGKCSVVVGVTDDQTSANNAVDLVQAGSAAVGGKGGGGRPDMAQAGGPDGDKAQAALDAIESAIKPPK